jgi:hypothetical protein
VRLRLGDCPVFLQRDRQIEVRVGVLGVQRDGVAIAGQRPLVAAEIVVNVAEVEVRLEAFGSSAMARS